MIFPPDSILELRHELAHKLDDGLITEAEVYRQGLAVDPHDPVALRFHAFAAETSGDFPLAEQFGLRLIRANPTSHEGYMLLRRVVSDADRALAYGHLGHLKLHFDPEAHAALDADPKLDPVPDAEPAAVTAEIEPHRLLHDLFVAGLDAVSAKVIDGILARGTDSAPLLLGVLNAYGEDLLADTDDALVVRSLALLGEIGEPSALAPIAKFIPLDDETLGGAARWAFLRIARRRPAESLAIVRNLAAAADPLDLAALAQQLCFLPETPQRTEALFALATNLEAFDKDGAALVVLSMLTSALLMEGRQSPLAASIESQFGKHLTRDARAELKTLRAEVDEARLEIADEKEPTIYEICLDAFEPADEEDQPYVRPDPKVGRNDPCWCGSGKKYKKCHLELDQHA
jgi:hypothetical protein